MSRRWYRHGAQVVFFGWEALDDAFYLNVVDLCAECNGTGETDATEEVCPRCGGEGLQVATMHPSNRIGGLTLEALARELDWRGLPLPDAVRADLLDDQRGRRTALQHEYELEP